MKNLKVGDTFILYNVVNMTDSVIGYLGDNCKKKTFIEKTDSIRSLASIYCESFPSSNKTLPFFTYSTEDYPNQQEVKPVARFKVKRLHNNDPITII